MLFVELIAQGLVQGSIYALIALGLTLVYGLLRMLHVAHAALFTLGGYVGVMVANQTGSLAAGDRRRHDRGRRRRHADVPPVLPTDPAPAAVRAADRLDRPVHRRRGNLPHHLRAAGPSSTNTQFLQGQVTLFGSLRFKEAEIAVMLGSAAIIGVSEPAAERARASAWPARRRCPTRRWRSPSASRRDQVRDINFFVGSALAAFAGVMVSVLNNLVEPTMGSVPSYKALAIIVLGGFGSVRGTLAAALVLGVVGVLRHDLRRTLPRPQCDRLRLPDPGADGGGRRACSPGR